MRPVRFDLAAILGRSGELALIAADGSELAVGGYRRAPVSWTFTGQRAVNADLVAFPATISGMDTAVAVGAVVGGVVVLTAPLARPQLVPAGVIVEFPAGSLVIDATVAE